MILIIIIYFMSLSTTFIIHDNLFHRNFVTEETEDCTITMDVTRGDFQYYKM